MSETGFAAIETVSDHFLDGALTLRQPAKGHKVGTDAVLLAAAVPDYPNGGLLVDIGAGVGTIGLAVAVRNPALEIVLLENDALIAELARQNLVLNDLAGRCSVLERDIFAKDCAGGHRDKADIVVTNPPFFAPGAIRPSPDAKKAKAHVMVGEGLVGWVRASLGFLKPGGLFMMIHRADALSDVLLACAGRLGAIKVLPIHPRQDRPATRIIVSGRKGSRAPMSLAQGLVLHAADGSFMPDVQAIQRGRGRISLP